MSYYLVIDNKTFDQIGSSAGYSDFGRWVDSIDAERYLELVHLYEHGACFNLDDLKTTIEDAIDTVGPHVADVRSTVENLLAVVKKRPKGSEVCYVTDGIGPDDGEDGDDDESASEGDADAGEDDASRKSVASGESGSGSGAGGQGDPDRPPGAISGNPAGADRDQGSKGGGADRGAGGSAGAGADLKTVGLGELDQKGFGPHEFSSTQVQLPPDVAAVLSVFGAGIPDDEIDPEDGRENDLHVTLRYGLHSADPEDVRPLLTGEGPITLTFGDASIFPADDRRNSDVLKIDVTSEDLARLNAKLAQLEHTDTRADYHPHATVAYLKPGMGQKYAGPMALTGKSVTVDSVTFSSKDNTRTAISLIAGKSMDNVSSEGSLADGGAAVDDDDTKAAKPPDNCPNCNACLEWGEDGKCNQCGKPWPGVKQAKDEGDDDDAEVKAKAAHLIGHHDPYDPQHAGAPPESDALEAKMVAIFRQQRAAVMGKLPTIAGDTKAIEEADVVTKAARRRWAGFDAEGMADDVRPVIEVSMCAGAKRTTARLGLADVPQVVNPEIPAQARKLALKFCESTNDSTTMRLDKALAYLRESLAQGLEQGEATRQLTERVEQIFDELETSHAKLIAQTESSRATHAGDLMTAVKSGVVRGKGWLASASACEKCEAFAAMGEIGLGEMFGEDDYGPIYHAPAHPLCECSTTFSLKSEDELE